MIAMHKLLRASAIVVALGLAAAACTNGDSSTADGDQSSDGEQTTAGEELPPTGPDVSTAADEATEEPAEPQNIAELEAHWAERRAEVVARLNDGDFGVGQDGILRGPGGFEVDLNQCPSEWSETEGIDDTTITIGSTGALTGTLASFGELTEGIEAYFDYVNDNGGIDGRTLELVAKDDGYLIDRTITAVEELLSTERPFAITTNGSPHTIAVYDTLNQNCVPQPLVNSAHPARSDPENHPFTTGLGQTRVTEAILWGEWIRTTLSDRLPVKVAALVMDNELGLVYQQALEDWMVENPGVISELQALPHFFAADTITAEMATIAAADPDVFITMTAGQPCLLAMQDAAENGLAESDVALIATSNCTSTESYMIPAGAAADGWYTIGGGLKDADRPGYEDDAYLSFVRDELDKAGFDPTVGLYRAGFALFGWTHVEALRIAAELDGGLTRSNLVLATRALDLDHPLVADGIEFSVNGSEDAHFIEGGQVFNYDANTQEWVEEGTILDANGSTPNCVWADERC